MSAPPPTLFRYYPADLRTLENIKRQCFYFGSVEKFNDPFECHVVAAPAQDEPELIELLRERYKTADFPPEVRAGIRDMDEPTFSNVIKKIAVQFVSDGKKEFIARRGVICFSERNENLLMWSHYSSGGSGLCLEFRTDWALFEGAEKVAYQKVPPKIDAMKLLKSAFQGTDAPWIVDMYCTKPEDWKYEQEWRIIHRQVGTAYIYPTTALKAVYFGPRCTQSFLETVCLVLLGQNKTVEFWRGSITGDKYAVAFEKFSYTPACDVPPSGA